MARLDWAWTQKIEANINKQMIKQQTKLIIVSFNWESLKAHQVSWAWLDEGYLRFDEKEVMFKAFYLMRSEDVLILKLLPHQFKWNQVVLRRQFPLYLASILQFFTIGKKFFALSLFNFHTAIVVQMFWRGIPCWTLIQEIHLVTKIVDSFCEHLKHW